jgi:hypothetical protein
MILSVNVTHCEERHAKEEAVPKELLIQEFVSSHERLMETASLAA